MLVSLLSFSFTILFFEILVTFGISFSRSFYFLLFFYEEQEVSNKKRGILDVGIPFDLCLATRIKGKTVFTLASQSSSSRNSLPKIMSDGPARAMKKEVLRVRVVELRNQIRVIASSAVCLLPPKSS